MKVAQIMGRGSSSELLQFGVQNIFSLILLPIIVGYLGVAGLGLWALIHSAAILLYLGQVGLREVLTKVIAEDLEDTERVSRLMSTTCAIYTAIITPLTLVLMVLAPNLADLFGVEADSRRAFITAFRILFAIQALYYIAGVYHSAVFAAGRLDWINYSKIGGSVVIFVLSLLFLRSGFGLVGLAWATFIGWLGQLLTGVVFMRIVLPGIRMSLRMVSRPEASILFGLSLKVFVSNIASLLNLQFPKLVIGAVLGPELVGLFHVAQVIGQVAAVLLQAVVLPLVPIVSELQASGNLERAVLVIGHAHRFLMAAAVALFGFMIAFPAQILDLYLSISAPEAILTLPVVATAYLINTLSVAPGTALLGLGRPEIQMRSSLIGVIANIGLTLAGILIFGFNGAVIGSSVSIVIMTALFFLMAAPHLQLSWGAILFPPLIAGGIATLVLLPLSLLSGLFEGHLLLLALAFVIYLAAFSILLIVVRLFSWSELSNLTSQIFRPDEE